MAVRVNKAGRYQTAGSVQHFHALRRIHLLADRRNFSIVADEQLAVFHFFAHNGLDFSTANQKHGMNLLLLFRSYLYIGWAKPF